MKKRTIRIIIIAVVLIVLLFPIRYQFKDGGTVDYKAILYNLTIWHSIDESYESGFYEAVELKYSRLTG